MSVRHILACQVRQALTIPVMTISNTCSALRYVRSAVRDMAPYVPGEQINDALKLNTNECAWPASPAVNRALYGASEDSSTDNLRLYPDPSASTLRQSAADLYGCSADQIIAGNGSDDCLTIIYRTFLEADGSCEVACPWPTYGLYDTLASIQGIRINHYDYAQRNNTWELPAALGQHNATLTLVANPNNPSGTHTPLLELRRLADQVEGILIVDEAYADFVSNDAERSLISVLDQHPNLIVLRTFSKSYSLAGARLGLLFAHPALVAEMNKVKDSYNVNALTQAVGTAALTDITYHAQLLSNTLAARKQLEIHLAALGWTWPQSEANFLLCTVGEQAHFIYEQLKERGILVRWWDTDLLRNCLRITVGTPENNTRLLAAIEDILS